MAYMYTLKEARENCGFTQKEAAKRIGCSYTSLCDYEQGRHQPLWYTIRQICRVYQLPFECLMLKGVDYYDDL